MAPLRILYELGTDGSLPDGGGPALRYALEIARALSDFEGVEIRVVGGACKARWGAMAGLWSRLDARRVEKEIKEFAPDVVHRFGPATPEKHKNGCVIVTTITEVSQLATTIPVPVDVLGHLICPSEHARRVAVDTLRIPVERVSVVPPGVHAPLAPPYVRPARGNYFLFIGTRQGQANFDSVLEAVATTPTLSNTRIVAFGGSPFSHGERKRIASLGVADRVTATSGDEIVLAGHLTSALALVHPQFSDDFGLPVLEAMAHGCPVACSRTSSLPEVGGNAALYFDPSDHADIATALVHLSADAGLRDRLSVAGRTRASEFAWKACAEKTIAVYRSLTPVVH